MSAILLGAEGITLVDYFESAVNALPGHAASFAVSWFGKVTSQSVASATRRLFAQRGSANQGWDLITTTTNSAAAFACGGNTGAAASPSSSITAADVGKLLLYTGVYDGIANVARLYAKRLQAGSGSTVTGGYAPDTAEKAMIGRRGSGSAADGVACYGVCYALGLPTLSQIQAHADAVMAEECMQHIPGLPGVLIDLRQDVLGSGGALPAVLLDRGTGGTHFAKVGSPALSSHYTRAWSW